MKKSELKKEIRERILEKKGKTADIDEMSTSGGAGAYNTPYAFKLKKKDKDLSEALNGDQQEALMDLQNILDRAAQLGDEARRIISDVFPEELRGAEAYDVFNFGSSSNSYDNTLESLISDIEQRFSEDEGDELDEDLSAYKETPMKMGDLDTNDDGVKKPIYFNYGYKLVDKSKS